MSGAAALFGKLTHGVYVIGVADGAKQNAFTAAWVMQVSFDPALLAFSINPKHYSYRLLQAGGVCSINVLAQNQLHLAEHFGAPGRDKMSICRWRQAETGAPVLPEALAYFDCRVSHYCDAGDHKLVVCEFAGGAVLNEGEPLLYRDTGDMDDSSGLYRDS